MIRTIIFLLSCFLASSALGQASRQINSGDITSALGYTPVNPANPQTPFGSLLQGSQPGGPLGSSSFAITNGTLNIWNPQLYGWGGSATAACFIAGVAFSNSNATQQGNCPVSGGFGTNAQPAGSGAASYTGRDAVGLLVQNFGAPPLFGSLNGSFTATTFVPSTPLNAAQIANLRIGMPIDTNDSPTPYSGIISGWATNGSSVTVQAWYKQGGPYVAGTPSGTAATISRANKVFGANFVSSRSSTSDAIFNTTIELDCDNNSGVDDTTIDDSGGSTPSDGCIDAINLGTNRASYAYLSRGKFVSQFTLQGDSTYGVHVQPTGTEAVGIAFSAQPGSGTASISEILRGWTPNGDLTARLTYANSVLELGRQKTTPTSPAINFWTSASGNNTGASFDSSITPSAGTGNGDGTLTVGANTFTVKESGGLTTFQVGHVNNASNYVLATPGASASGNAFLSAVGGDGNVNLQLVAKGGNSISLNTGGDNTGTTGTPQVNITPNGLQFKRILTVATLPTCNGGAEGTWLAVSDATAPTYNTVLTGGGAVHIPVYCNGTSWTAH